MTPDQHIKAKTVCAWLTRPERITGSMLQDYLDEMDRQYGHPDPATVAEVGALFDDAWGGPTFEQHETGDPRNGLPIEPEWPYNVIVRRWRSWRNWRRLAHECGTTPRCVKQVFREAHARYSRPITETGEAGSQTDQNGSSGEADQ